MNLLIVDDNAQMRRTLRDMTSGLVERYFECADGGEALALYAAKRPDWVLMDIEMKRVDGISATRLIVGQFPEARILVVTNYDDAELREAAHLAGARAYVVKENLLDLRRILGAPARH